MQAVTQQLFGPCAKGIEIPASFEDLGELGELDVTLLARLSFEDVQTNRNIGVRRLYDDQPVAEVGSSPPFFCRHHAQQDRRRITMQIEEHKPAAAANVLA